MEKNASSEQRNLAGRNIDPIDNINKDEPSLNLQSEKYLQSLLASLRRDQLVDLLVDTLGRRNPVVAEGIRAVVSSHPTNRRLYVNGLSVRTTLESLCDAFSSHGEIEEGAVVVDKATGTSRGFGFITFKKAESVEEALQQPWRMIDGSPASCELSAFRVEPKGKEKETQEKPVTYDPHAIAQQHYQLQFDLVPHPHFSGNEPSGIPSAFATPLISEYYFVPHPHVSGSLLYGYPAVPHPPVIGNGPYGIPLVYPTQFPGYPAVPHPPVRGNGPYGIPLVYPTQIPGYPAVPHPPVRGNGPYGIPLVYPTEISGGYPAVPHPPVSENPPN